MGQFQYKPAGRRRGRQKYLGALTEPSPEPIPFQFSAESLRTVLRRGLSTSEEAFTHQAIAHWCGAAAHAWRDTLDQLGQTPHENPLDLAFDVAEDVAAQWEITLASWPGGLAALNGVEASAVRFPDQWFHTWLKQLDRSAPE